MSEPVLDWDRTIHKNVRSKDMEDGGNIFAIIGDTLTIMGSKGREYRIPKSRVEGFNGSEVFLNLSFRELRDYEVKA
jgi:hypothetical protein